MGYALELSAFGIRPRLGACRSSYENESVRAVTRELSFETRLTRTWDPRWLSFDLGVGGGAALFWQSFESVGRAPARKSLSPFLTITLGATRELYRGLYLGGELQGETHFLRTRARQESQREVAFALRAGVLVGKRF